MEMDEKQWKWISTHLIDWFIKEGRDLPWRRDVTPYKVWISEIMLQQTRVEAVKPYYARFMERLPGIRDLADISQEELDKLWQGLGYYSRARNLKKCAQVLMADYGGEMPDRYELLLKLPGIGSYTAGAIASFAFNRPVAAVDGNVLRVVSRLWGSERDIARPDTKKYVEREITAFLEHTDCEPRLFNGALMELGALVCGPDKKPSCASCPVARMCAANKDGRQEELPVKSPKKPRRVEDWTVYLVTDGVRFLIEKRPEQGLLAGLYQFPSLPGSRGPEEILEEDVPIENRFAKGPDGKHIFTHIEWRMTSWVLRLSGAELEALQSDVRVLATGEELSSRYAVPNAYGIYRDLAKQL
jgi:A/G-specific adenine glycosylase